MAARFEYPDSIFPTLGMDSEKSASLSSRREELFSLGHVPSNLHRVHGLLLAHFELRHDFIAVVMGDVVLIQSPRLSKLAALSLHHRPW